MENEIFEAVEAEVVTFSAVIGTRAASSNDWF
jgi:hypothetical protein